MQTLTALSNQQIHAILGQRLKSVREQRGISLVDAGTKLGISVREMNRIEHGEAQIYAGHIARFSRCYQITPNELFLGLAHSTGVQVSEQEVAHLLERFLQIDEPGRGDLFKGLVASIAANEPGA